MRPLFAGPLLALLSLPRTRPFVPLPAPMLPSDALGFRYDGTLAELPVAGAYYLEPCGEGCWRNWQNASFGPGSPGAELYGVALANGTYLQAAIDIPSGRCEPFAEQVACTDWWRVQPKWWANACDVVRGGDGGTGGEMVIRIRERDGEPSKVAEMLASVTVGETKTGYEFKVLEDLEGRVPRTSCGF
ncbi:hypothetical protein DFJ74DRAFT_654763 [Hyaloraphidium curvatum]|nr:hypothetical protein DFJ74DRAFT_654763 [Hyaloraphidium curvatum]